MAPAIIPRPRIAPTVTAAGTSRSTAAISSTTPLPIRPPGSAPTLVKM